MRPTAVPVFRVDSLDESLEALKPAVRLHWWADGELLHHERFDRDANGDADPAQLAVAWTKVLAMLAERRWPTHAKDARLHHLRWRANELGVKLQEDQNDRDIAFVEYGGEVTWIEGGTFDDQEREVTALLDSIQARLAGSPKTSD